MKDYKKILRKNLEAEEFFLLPGIYDCLTAKLAEKAQFNALFFSGGSFSFSNLGVPDIGFFNPSEALHMLRNIISLVDIPVISDVDNGFGNAIHAAHIAKSMEDIGVAGLQIDDQSLPQHIPTTTKEAIEWNLVEPKIKAIRNEVSDDFVIIFRTITNITDNLETAIKRINLAAELGADYAYVDGLKSEEEVQKVAQEAKIKLLINMNEKGICAKLPIEDIKNYGYKIGLYPVSTMAIAAKSIYDLLTNLRERETTLNMQDKMFNVIDLYNEFGLQELTDKYKELY